MKINRLKDLKALVEKQAIDPAVWFIAETAPEAYLQKELRRLHEICEKFIEEFEGGKHG